MTNNWTYEEFHAFVMLYAANVDGHITQDEINLITPTLEPEAYKRIYGIFKQLDDSKALDLILSYRDRYCSTPADRQKILADMVKIYEANKVFEQIERGVHTMFQRML